MPESSTPCVALKGVPRVPCREPAFRWLGQIPLCGRHYDKAIEAARRTMRREMDAEERFMYGEREWEASAAEVIYYLRRSDGLIKIGVSAVFRARLSGLRAEHGSLQILLTHRGDRETEQALHRKFRNYRAEGEFFRPSKPLLNWIIRVRKRQPEPTLLRGTLPLVVVKSLIS